MQIPVDDTFFTVSIKQAKHYTTHKTVHCTTLHRILEHSYNKTNTALEKRNKVCKGWEAVRESSTLRHLREKRLSDKSTYLLTYSKENSPSWEANWFAAGQEIPRSLCNPRVHYRTHKCLQPVLILCQINPVHVTKYSSQEKVSEIQMWQCSVLMKTHHLCVAEARYL